MFFLPRSIYLRPFLQAHTRNINTTISETSHLSSHSKHFIALERNHGAYNYHPIPVVLDTANGTRVWDVEGREYLDFLAAYSAVNQGHCHPKIINAIASQSAKLSLTSRAFHHTLLGPFLKRLCDDFKYDKCILMNTGVEGGETAIKLARKWGYKVKGIPENTAKVIFAKDNFWGRTIAAVSSSTDPVSTTDFGPFVPAFDIVDYDNLKQLEAAISDTHVCAFMVEPIQGEAGVIIPHAGYLKGVSELCKKHNVLMIADEVQTGLGRTGKMRACEHEDVKPDLTILGKALSGGLYPVSAVLGSDEVLGLLKPGEHGSTYGGNPLACAVGVAALNVIQEEKLCERSQKMGRLFRELLQDVKKDVDVLKSIRGKGLMNAIVVEDVHGQQKTAWTICLEMAKRGLLAKPTHGHIIRLTPPLCIEEAEVEKATSIIREALKVIEVDVS